MFIESLTPLRICGVFYHFGRSRKSHKPKSAARKAPVSDIQKRGHREIPIDFNSAVTVLYCFLKRYPTLGIGKFSDWSHIDTEKQEILL